MTELEKLKNIVKDLRGKDGCPWDKEQTFISLKPHVIEEAYELVDALDKQDFCLLREELGDVLLHVVMISEMASEIGEFSLSDVAAHVSEKMIRRHPHVFGDIKVDSVDDVWKNWDMIKSTEKDEGVLESIPNQLPALKRAEKLQKKAAKSGFDWKSIQGPLEKLKEEISEFSDAVSKGEIDEKQIDEFGDVLFSIVNVGRYLKIDCEAALQFSNDKFKSRFNMMESLAKKDDVSLKSLTLVNWDRYWNDAKAVGKVFDTRSAGGVVINRRLGKVAMVSQNGNSWSLPKGHLESNESDMDAALREIQEETGLKNISFIENLGEYTRYKIGKDGRDDKSERKTLVFFLFETTEDTLCPEDEKNPVASWIDPRDVSKKLTHPSDSIFFANNLDKIQNSLAQ
jgi:MazG family protein